MISGYSLRRAVGLSLLGVAVAATGASAQTNPFGNKPLTMIIGFGPGGGYDTWGRLVAKHIGKHLPGTPNTVAQNMPGAGSFQAASNIYNLAPKDGTVMAIIARDAPLGPIPGAEGARCAPVKLSWLGTPTTETNVACAPSASRLRTTGPAPPSIRSSRACVKIGIGASGEMRSTVPYINRSSIISPTHRICIALNRSR